jgi:hypothetical protein
MEACMRRIVKSVLLVLLISGFTTSQGQQMLSFTTTEHGLLCNDRPFFWLGDTGWLLMQKSPDDVIFYLNDRAAKHFTVIQMMAIRTEFADKKPTGRLVQNYAGETPFTSLDPVTLNEAYWRHIDFIIDAARKTNLIVAIATMWGRDADSLFPKALKNNELYGKLLGHRYRNKDNVFWLVTGEYEKINDNWRRDKQVISEQQRTLLRAIANDLEAGHEGRHLMTIHPVGTSSDDFHNDSWLDFNMQQTWGHSNADVTRISADYRRQPAKPVLNGEPGYENRPEAPSSTAWKCRYEGYWSVFSGAFGFTYGANRIWQFHLDWKDALQYEGAADMQHLRFLMESRPMRKRIPDQSILTSDNGKFNGKTTYCAATRASAGSYVMVYSTMGEPFTIDLKVISGSHINAWWYSPRDGRCYNEKFQQTTEPFEIENTHRPQEFTPPTYGLNQDWVLVLDDAERKFPAPGTRR